MPKVGEGVVTSRPATILVVEDEPAIRRMIRAVLQRAGFTVLEAANGSQALLVCRSHPAPIDLAVTYIVMPGMGGLDLASELDSMSCATKILYISGMETSVAVTSLTSSAPDLMLTKPFSPEELLERVHRLLASSAGGAETAP